MAYLVYQVFWEVKDNDIVKIPYRHPNHTSHFDQRQGQNVHKQRGYDVKCEATQNLQPKQKTRRFTQQGNRHSTSIW